MKVSLAHIRERSTSGGSIDFVVFDAKSNSDSASAKSELLAQLTLKARYAGLKVDKSALAYSKNRGIEFFGTPDLVDYLSKQGLPGWTHQIDV